jgi:hypothetical protein
MLDAHRGPFLLRPDVLTIGAFYFRTKIQEEQVTLMRSLLWLVLVFSVLTFAQNIPKSISLTDHSNVPSQEIVTALGVVAMRRRYHRRDWRTTPAPQ